MGAFGASTARSTATIGAGEWRCEAAAGERAERPLPVMRIH